MASRVVPVELPAACKRGFLPDCLASLPSASHWSDCPVNLFCAQCRASTQALECGQPGFHPRSPTIPSCVHVAPAARFRAHHSKIPIVPKKVLQHKRSRPPLVRTWSPSSQKGAAGFCTQVGTAGFCPPTKSSKLFGTCPHFSFCTHPFNHSLLPVTENSPSSVTSLHCSTLTSPLGIHTSTQSPFKGSFRPVANGSKPPRRAFRRSTYIYIHCPTSSRTHSPHQV